MNILLIGYCHLSDGFLYASKALEEFNHKIYFFPYLIYKMDQNPNLIQDLKNSIVENNIDICLWWNNSILFDEINEIIDFSKKINQTEENKNKQQFKIKHIFFNWDPFLYDFYKYNVSNYWKPLIDKKKEVYRLMDMIFTCFEKEKQYFQSIPYKYKIYYNPPGFDKNASKYIYNENYTCDISFVLTNLYNNQQEFPQEATNLNRFTIVNKLYEKRDTIKFHIYGPENFKHIYPECYKGFIKYDDSHIIFSNSKINLSIHPIIHELNSENSSEEYFSERVPQILGCQGLLMTNSNFSNILKKDEDYLHIHEEMDYIGLIENILHNYDNYKQIKINGYNKALLHYQWKNWANIIHNNITE